VYSWDEVMKLSKEDIVIITIELLVVTAFMTAISVLLSG